MFACHDYKALTNHLILRALVASSRLIVLRLPLAHTLQHVDQALYMLKKKLFHKKKKFEHGFHFA